jgi:hypothetical protein
MDRTSYLNNLGTVVATALLTGTVVTLAAILVLP